jgi:hypothetical protein
MEGEQIDIQVQETLTLYIEDIRKCVKTIPTKDGYIKIRHDVTCRDKTGKRSTFEYLTLENAPLEFFKGTYQQVRCVYKNAKGATVEPVADVAHQQGHVNSNAKSTPLTGGVYMAKVGGASYTFAMGFAKDIFCAVIKTWAVGMVMAPEDCDLIVKIADVIQNQLAERMADVNISENAYQLPIGGTSYLFALGFAKDLLCAEISKWGPGINVVKGDDIMHMFQHADKLHAAMTERFTF